MQVFVLRAKKLDLGSIAPLCPDLALSGVQWEEPVVEGRRRGYSPAWPLHVLGSEGVRILCYFSAVLLLPHWMGGGCGFIVPPVTRGIVLVGLVMDPAHDLGGVAVR